MVAMRTRHNGSARCLSLAAVVSVLACLALRFELSPVNVAPYTPPPLSAFHVGDRVKLKYPMAISNEGRGYFNEGAGEGVPPHLRDEEEDQRELDELTKVIEGGNEGLVVGIMPAGEWANKPAGWKGHPRPAVLVNWDDQTLPLDMTEETDLELLDSSLAEKLRAQRKSKAKTPAA